MRSPPFVPLYRPLVAIASRRRIPYHASMRQLVRRFFVTFLALAFFGAVLERSALGDPDEPCPFSSQADQVVHGSHAGHHHHHTGKQDSSSAQICLKCCGLCMADAYLTAAPLTEFVLLTTPVVFSAGFDAYSGSPVVLDPGIPKRSA